MYSFTKSGIVLVAVLTLTVASPFAKEAGNEKALENALLRYIEQAIAAKDYDESGELCSSMQHERVVWTYLLLHWSSF